MNSRAQISHLMILLLTSLMLFSCSGPRVQESIQELGANRDYRRLVDALCNPLIEQKRNIGILVGIVTRDGEYTFSYGGFSPDEPNKRLEPDHLFLVGSPTKLFTVTLMNELAAQGKLSIDDPITLLSGTDVEIKNSKTRRIKLKELASHSSGLGREAIDLSMLHNLIAYQFTGDNFYSNLTTQKLTEYVAEFEISDLSPRRYLYSNIGMSFLGWLMGGIGRPESLTRFENYERLLQQVVFEPLGLKDTALNLSPDQRSRLALGFSGDSPPFWPRHQPIRPWSVQQAMWPSGGIYTSLTDAMTLLKVNMGLKKTSLKQDFKAAHLARARTKKGGVGLGWFSEVLPSSKLRAIYVDGVSDGFTSFIGMDSTYQVGVVVLQNNINWDDRVGIPLLDRLSTLLHF